VLILELFHLDCPAKTSQDQYNFRGITMKNIVRAFVVALALTGFAASTQISTTSATSKTTVAKTSFVPIPSCPPHDPNACGM
jgi:hypothetical protein